MTNLSEPVTFRLGCVFLLFLMPIPDDSLRVSLSLSNFHVFSLVSCQNIANYQASLAKTYNELMALLLAELQKVALCFYVP